MATRGTWTVGRLLVHRVQSAPAVEEHCSSDTFHLRCPALGVDDSAAGSGPVSQQSRFSGDSEVIVIHRADYGRMRPARRCISAAYAESMGCQADVVGHMHSVCTGRPNCSLLVATMDSVSQPCPKDFKSYVEVVYECVTVSFIDDCTRQTHQPHNLTSHHGASSLSSAATRLNTERGHLALFPNPERPHATPIAEHSTSSGGCYWLIEAPPGQTIRVAWKLVGGVQPVATGTRRRNKDAPAAVNDKEYTVDVDGSSIAESCSVAVMFRDGDRGATVTRAACDGGRPTLRGQQQRGQGQTESRRQHAAFASNHGIYRNDDDGNEHGEDFDEEAGIFFQSKSNRLEIHPAVSSADPVVSNDVVRTVADKWQPYILQYKFVGCEDVIPPSNDASVERVGDVTTITCAGEDDEPRERWQVVCQKGAWVGEIGNCSRPASMDTRFSSIKPGQQSYNDIRNGVVLAVLIGIFLGVTVGACLMMIVFVAKNRGSRYFKHDPAATDASMPLPAVGPQFHVELRGGGCDPYEMRRTAAISSDPDTCTPPSSMGIYRSAGTCCDCAGAVVMTMPFISETDGGGIMPQLSTTTTSAGREQQRRKHHHHHQSQQQHQQPGPLPPPPPSVVMTSYMFNQSTAITPDDTDDASLPRATTRDVLPMTSFYSGRTTKVGGFYAPSGNRSTGFRCPSDASSDSTSDRTERIGRSAAGSRPSTASTCCSDRSNDANTLSERQSLQTVAPTSDHFAFDLLRHNEKSVTQ